MPERPIALSPDFAAELRAMLQNLNERVRLCYERAAEAKRYADESTDAAAKSDFLNTERRWLLLAQSYQLSDRADSFIRSIPARRLPPLFDPHALLRASGASIFAKDTRSRMLFMTPVGLELIGRRWEEIAGRDETQWHDDRVQARTIRANDALVMESAQSQACEETFNTPGGERVFLCIKSPLRGTDDQIVGTVGIARDITEEKKREEEAEVVQRELGHRLKNSLALVQAIARQTISPGEELRKFEGRLAAYSRSQNLILGRMGERVRLRELIEVHRLAFNMDGRVAMEGEPVTVSPHFATQIGMALHELATNSLKYGALGSNGHVNIAWTTAVQEDGTRRLTLTWHERHDRGSAAVREGFGHVILTRAVPTSLNGTASLVHGSGELCWTLHAELDDWIA